MTEYVPALMGKACIVKKLMTILLAMMAFRAVTRHGVRFVGPMKSERPLYRPEVSV